MYDAFYSFCRESKKLEAIAEDIGMKDIQSLLMNMRLHGPSKKFARAAEEGVWRIVEECEKRQKAGEPMRLHFEEAWGVAARYIDAMSRLVEE